jgi:hypothetical protein
MAEDRISDILDIAVSKNIYISTAIEALYEILVGPSASSA